MKTTVRSEASDDSVCVSTTLNGSSDDSYQDAKDDT